MPKVKPLKRANGTGSVYKLKHKRLNRPWVAAVSYRDNELNLKQRIIGTYTTKTEADMALARYDLSPIERPNIKLSQVYEEWSAIKFRRLSKSTVDNYKSAYRALNIYYNKKFRDLRTAQFQAIVDEYENTHSRSWLSKYKALVTGLYDYAIEHDICNKNYGKFIKLPKAEKKNYVNFTINDVREMFKYDHDDIIKIILIMVHTGFRPGAALELTKFSYDRENKMFVGGIKTSAGINRPVPIHPDIQEYVDYFDNLNGETLLCKPNGKAYRLDKFRPYDYYPTLEKYGFKKVQPRNCRHTFATAMKMYDADEVAITKIIGHTDYKFTQKVYTQPEVEYLHSQVNKMKIKV